MKLVLAAAATALACLIPAAASAQAVPAVAPAPVPAAKFNLDTPIEALAADEKAKAVIDSDLPGLLTHPSYEMFKGMSLRQVQPYSEGALTDEALKKAETNLAAIK